MTRKKRRLRKQAKILLSIIVICLSSIIVRKIYKFIHPVVENPTVQVKPAEKPSRPVDNAKKGSIDILAVGNSDLFSGFIPLQLWNDTGMTSYVAGGQKQNMSLSYYMVEEIFKYQKPKVLILELDNFFETRGDDNRETALTTVYKTCYPLFKETPLWNQLRFKSYTKRENANPRTLIKGYYYKTAIKSNTRGYDYMGENAGEEPMVSYTEQYFSKIMDIAKENNCEVIFMCMPSASSWTYKKHNTVAKYAKQYNVPFLDMNVDDYGSGFDWSTDTRDAGNHLNYNGAQKVTRFLGEYLRTHYQLIDHRENENFSDWNEDFEYFTSLLNQ